MVSLSRIAALVVALAAGPALADPDPVLVPVLVGVSGPLTGPSAQYGAQWQKGFALALDEVNGRGGIGGRPL